MSIRDIDGQLRLRGMDGAPILDSPETETLAPAQWLIHEWREYAIEWNDEVEVRAGIKLLGCKSRQVGSAVVFCFQNYLGLAHLEVRTAGRATQLTVEVLSPKFSTPEAYLAFYRPLVKKLAERAIGLPFALQSPTALRTRESLRPASDLFIWHFLRQEADHVLGALRTVLRNPRRALTVEDRYVELDLASSADAQNLGEILERPQELLPIGRERQSYGWPLARALEQRSTGRRFLPEHVWEARAEETLDTPEHRFVRAFLEELVNTVTRLNQRLSGFQVDLQPLTRLRAELMDALSTTFLAEVGEMTVFPSTSRVLQRADGYRELLQFWRLLHMAMDPFDTLQRALDVRDIGVLYEWWCFYALVDRFGQIFQSQPRVSDGTDDIAGLRHGIRAAFPGGWDLVFNRTFARGAGVWNSYSVNLRPDFVLVRDKKPLIAIDAKFRFEETDWQLADDLIGGEASDMARDDGSWQKSLSERLAKKADIYKMHTYRDALQLRAAAVVYPGRSGDQSVFYGVSGQILTPLLLSTLVVAEPPIGVGALPLTPEET